MTDRPTAAEVRVKRVADREFVVADDGGWIDGVYASEEAARCAANVPTKKLADLWNSLAGPDGIIRQTITIDMLAALTPQERADD